MVNFTRRALLQMTTAATLSIGVGATAAFAEDMERRAEIDAAADASMAKLLADNEAARALSEKASAFLIFPKITEVGLAGIGVERGAGVLRQKERASRITTQQVPTLDLSLDLQRTDTLSCS